MKIIRHPSEHPEVSSVVTIGYFDGVHRGHQALLKRLSQIAEQEMKKSTVITFSNHPSQVLRPEKPIFHLCTLSHKIHLLEQSGVDILLLQNFTKEFSQQTAQEFLQHIHGHLLFSHLILGYDAAFGRDKGGDVGRVHEISKKLGFEVEYLPPFKIDEEIISSTFIRKSIQEGDFARAEKFLGRRYSIYGEVSKKDSKTYLDITNICIPPMGIYSITVEYGGKRIHGVAHLTNNSWMEIRVPEDVSGQLIEVIF
jgi:riboflavin kinase/FMN adenylyltransferase